MRILPLLPLCLAICLAGCAQKIPKDALALPQEPLANRQMQTRIYETTDYQAMLSAAAGVMQDLGFTLEEAEYSLGLVTGSKSRDATSGGQIAASVFLAALTGAAMPWDKTQHIRISMVMRALDTQGPKAPESAPAAGKKSKKQGREPIPPAVDVKNGRSTVRVTFQRLIYNTANQVSRAEQINEPQIYTEFFDKLSQAVFLEAQQL